MYWSIVHIFLLKIHHIFIYNTIYLAIPFNLLLHNERSVLPSQIKFYVHEIIIHMLGQIVLNASALLCEHCCK